MNLSRKIIRDSIYSQRVKNILQWGLVLTIGFSIIITMAELNKMYDFIIANGTEVQIMMTRYIGGMVMLLMVMISGLWVGRN